MSSASSANPTSSTRSTITEQARAAETSVLVVAQRDRAAILVTGKDRTTWLNGLVTCELAKLAPEQGAYGLLVEKKGRIQTDLYIAPSAFEPPAFVLAVPRELRERVVATLDHYLIMEDAELTAPELVFYAAHGPRAHELVARAREGAAFASYAGVVDMLGKGGGVFAVPTEERADFEAKLHAEVERLGGVVGDEAGWEAVRIAHGLPRFGVEFDGTLYPQEASLEKLAVSFSKGCYLGQEVVYMLENRGHVKRKLVALDLVGDAVPASGAAITTLEGEAVGDVKSAVLAPLGEAATAIGMVKWAHAKPGTELLVDGRGARVRG